MSEKNFCWSTLSPSKPSVCLPEEPLLWNHKPLLKGSFFIWDVENISIKYFEEIKRCVSFTPERLFAISKRTLSKKELRFFHHHGFILFTHYPLSADEKIMGVIRVHQGCTHLVLLSSDGDFVPSVKRYLEKHHVQWIMDGYKKRRICMSINLSHPRLILSCLYGAKPPKTGPMKRPKRHKKTPKRGKNYEAFLIPRDQWVDDLPY